MNINEYINKLWSSLLADDVPSDFGNVTYYGLLKDTLLLFKKLNEEWEIKKDGFNEQIDSAVKILNSAMELLNSVDTSVDELNVKYSEFVNTVNTEIARFENETNSKIEQLSSSIGEIIDEYMNSPDFESKINEKISQVLEDSGFKELIQGIIAETTIEFNKVDVSGSNSIRFFNVMASNGALLRKSNINEHRTMEKDLIFNNNVDISMKLTTGVILSLMLISSNNTFIVGNSGIAMQLKSNIRALVYDGTTPHNIAYLYEVNACIKKNNPSIPYTSSFKIGDKMAIHSDSNGNTIIFGDYNSTTCLSVKDINSRPKMRTESGVNFDLSTKNDVTVEVKKQINSYMDKIYHVGRIIETIDESFDPNTIIGHWELYGKGRVTICVDKDNPLMNKAGMTLGEYEHTLTIDEMPAHNHPESVPELIQNTATGSVQYGYIANGARSATEMAGGGQPHNNMQPSITVYRWIRIS